MTTEHKIRIKQARADAQGIVAPYYSPDIAFLLRLLDEARAERDAYADRWRAVTKECDKALQQHERDQLRIRQLDDENQSFMREVAELRQQHEPAMAALREIADALEFVCDGVTASCCYAYATKQIAEETLMAALDAATAAGDAKDD